MKLTDYLFFSSLMFGGPYAETTKQIPGAPNPLGWTFYNNQGGTVQRDDNESLLHLTSLAQNFKPLITNMLPANVTLTSGPVAQMLDYASTPYFFLNKYSQNQLLFSAWFTVHIVTPAPASNAEASISYYVIPSITGGKLSLKVDEFSYVKRLSGGFLAGDQLETKLHAAAQNAIPGIQSALSAAANKLPGNLKGQYLLPGDGSVAATSTGVGYFDATLALV